MRTFSRRDFLTVAIGSVAAGGWRPAGKRPLILVWLGGGPSSFDTFDPHLSAPESIRGEFSSISTQLPGLRFCEHLPGLAARADRFALVRSLVVPVPDHWAASMDMLQARQGKTLALQVSAQEPDRVPYSLIAAPLGSYIEQAHRANLAFNLKWCPIQERYQPHPGLLGSPDSRLAERRDLIGKLSPFVIPNPALDAKVDQQRDLAFELLLDGPARKRLLAAFDLPEEDKERYGGSSMSDGLLLAGRLATAGVSSVTLVYESDGGWDQHQNIFKRLPVMCSKLDKALSALLDDMRDGKVEDCTLLVTGEFTRTPKVNGAGGRDHWKEGGFALLAGGGVVAGAVLGAVDGTGYVRDRPVSPAALNATVMAACGLRVPDSAEVLRSLIRNS